MSALESRIEKFISLFGLLFFFGGILLLFCIQNKEWLALIVGSICLLGGFLVGHIYGSDKKEEKLRDEWLKTGKIERWEKI
jgi:hypothetical protein